MTCVKAIETEYNGYRFRSRLEAKWAVFFDQMGIKYEYEPEGFELGDGSRYLPDFLLHIHCRNYEGLDEVPIYAEVKGQLTEYDLKRIERFANDERVILLGNIPKDHYEYYDNAPYGFHSYYFIDRDEYPAFFAIYKGVPWICGADHDEWDCGKSMDKALKKARQARFEFGEKGA